MAPPKVSPAPAPEPGGGRASSATTSRRSRRERLVLLGILALALTLRLGHWWTSRDAPFVGQLVMDSWEYHRWGAEIAAGQWLGALPFFQAPLYPYLLGALYTVGGPHPDLAYLLQILLAVGALAALYETGRRWEGPACGLAAAGLGALSGPLVFHDVLLLKESMATSLVAGLLLALSRARARPGLAPWWGAGLLLGLLATLRENALLLAPLLAALALVRPRPPRPGVVALTFLSGVALILAVPAVRNLVVTGDLLVTSYQGGVNFYIGNHPGADGTYRPLTPGKQIPGQERVEPVRLAAQALGRTPSPAEVSRYWWGQSLAWAAAEPLSFLQLQLRKLGLFFSFYEWPDAVDYYWVRRQSPWLRGAFVELGALIVLAAVGLLLVARRWALWSPALFWAAGWTAATVLFFLFSRYRLPIFPALLLLAAVPLGRIGGGLARGRSRWPWLGALGVVAALLLPHGLGFRPRLDLVHYNLARLHDEASRPAEARRHYLLALEADPDNFLCLMNLGTQAAREGRFEEASTWLERAGRVESGSDDLWANLGGVHLATGDLTTAEEDLAEALRLNPGNAFALHNLALLRVRQGRHEEARELNLRLLAVDPQHAPGRRLRERLERQEPLPR